MGIFILGAQVRPQTCFATDNKVLLLVNIKLLITIPPLPPPPPPPTHSAHNDVNNTNHTTRTAAYHTTKTETTTK